MFIIVQTVSLSGGKGRKGKGKRPQPVTSAPYMSVFRGRLKAFFFRHCFPWLSPQLLWCLCSDSVVIFEHFNRSF